MAKSLWKRFLKSLSGPAAPRRPERVQLAVETMEARIMPTVFVGVDGDGTLEITTNAGDDVTIDHTGPSFFGGTTLVNGRQFPDTGTGSINIHGGFNNVNIVATSKAVDVADNAFITVGSANVDHNGNLTPGFGNMQRILEPLFLGTANKVNLDDSNDPTFTNPMLDVQGDGVELQHMSPGEIFVTPQGGFLNTDVLRNLNLFGGTGGNVFNVLDTPAAFLAFTNVTTTNIHTGTGGDDVFVSGSHSAQLNIQGGGFFSNHDFVEIGNGNVGFIQSPIKITNPPSFTSLEVNASSDTSFENVTMSIANGVGTIHGLTPQDITYNVGDVSGVGVQGGNHGSTFTVQDTFKNPSFGSGFNSTVIDPGLGTNTINVLGTTGELRLEGSGGRDTVNVGGDRNTAGTLTRIRGEVDVFTAGGGANTNLILNAKADNFNHGVTLQAPDAFEGEITGLAQAAPIFYDPAGLSVLQLFGGNGSDQFFVQSVLAVTGQIFIHGGSGNDFFNIGSPSNNLDNIQSTVNVIAGQGGHNTLLVNDGNAALGHSYSFPTNLIVRTGGGTPQVTIVYINIPVANVKVIENGNPGAAAQDLALPRHVRVGAPATLTGQLVDDDQSQVLSLTVIWGDGSVPDQLTPDRDPFAVTHTYASPGVYTVHAIWSDSDGVSNTRDLTIRVGTTWTPIPARHGAAGDAAVANGLDAFFAVLGGDPQHRGAA